MHGLRICPDLDSVMYTLGGGIDPERGWGRARRDLAGQGRTRDLRRRADLVRPRRPRPRHPSGAHPDARRRLPAVGRDRRAVPALAARGAAAADDRPAVRDPRRGRTRRGAPGHPFPGVVDQAPGRHPRRRRSSRSASTTPRRRRACSTRSTAADVVLIAPSNPVVSIGTILGRARHPRRDCAPLRPRSSGSRRSSAGRRCAAWPTRACRSSASRSAPRASGATTARGPPTACSTAG